MNSKESRREQVRKQLKAASPAILPSLLLCDFANLEREVRCLEEAGVKALHLDVMDGNFVPNLTYGMPIVEALRRVTTLPLDVHLMISHPEKYALDFVKAGADAITFHVETAADHRSLIHAIQDAGVLAGLAINPATDFGKLDGMVELCDLLLVMSVAAGFGGQPFQNIALDRLRQLRQAMPNLLLEVDGGVNAETIGSCVQAGADLLVVGSAIFRESDYGKAIKGLMSKIDLTR